MVKATSSARPSPETLRASVAWAGWLAAFALLLVAGCATIDIAEIERRPSHAWENPASTRLGRQLYADPRAKSGQSAFRLLESGLDSFAARLALIDAAERTLDLQYYIVAGRTSAIIVDRLLGAAARGVRVRLLIDDISTHRSEDALVALDGVANVEVRTFNPFLMRGPATALAALEVVARGAQLNRRMHNKAFVADNAYAIVGGRNLGDEYFGAEAEVDFQDLDVLAAGPVVRAISDSFDRYWNSPLSIPISALAPRATDDARTLARQQLAKGRTAALEGEYGRRLRESPVTRDIARAVPPSTWARSRVLVDEPEKVVPGETDRSNDLADSLERAIARASSDITVVTAYMIPGEGGVALLREAVRRGVRVRVLTNSLATTDVVAAFSGYARYRVDLLEAGVALYELQPTATAGEREKRGVVRSGSRAALHAKAIAIDHRFAIIGSPNLDPRSLRLNTEIALLIDSPVLALGVERRFDDAASPESSFGVVLVPGTRELRWESTIGGRAATWSDEPEAPAERRVTDAFLRLVPLDSQL